MALGYATIVQIGAFLWPDGLKWVKMGSKWAQFTHLSTPKGLGSFWEKTCPALSRFCPIFSSQTAHFQGFLGILEGPKWLKTSSKWAHFTCLCTPNGRGSFLEKHVFDPVFDPFVVPKAGCWQIYGEWRVFIKKNSHSNP